MKLIKNIKLINTDKLMPYINKPKKHPDEQIKKLAESIKEFGFIVPVIVRDDLRENQVCAFRIADNKLAESEWSLEELMVEMEVLNLDDYDLDFTGFDESEL